MQKNPQKVGDKGPGGDGVECGRVSGGSGGGL